VHFLELQSVTTHHLDLELNSSCGIWFFRAKDHEVSNYDTEQIVDVPGTDDTQGEGEQYAIF